MNVNDNTCNSLNTDRVTGISTDNNISISNNIDINNNTNAGISIDISISNQNEEERRMIVKERARKSEKWKPEMCRKN